MELIEGKTSNTTNLTNMYFICIYVHCMYSSIYLNIFLAIKSRQVCIKGAYLELFSAKLVFKESLSVCLEKGMETLYGSIVMEMLNMY